MNTTKDVMSSPRVNSKKLEMLIGDIIKGRVLVHETIKFME